MSSFLLLARPPRAILFPYTTLFRSRREAADSVCAAGYSSLLSFSLPGATPQEPGIGEGHLSPGRGFPPELEGAESGSSGSTRSEEHTSELQSLRHLVCRLLLEKKKH